MKIKIKYLNETVKRLEKIEKGDWIDLYSAEDVELKQGIHTMIHLGVAIELPAGYEAIIAPRSSSFKKWGFLQTNSIGVIDNSYKGDNDWWYLSVYPTRDSFIKKGEKICQFRIQKCMENITFEEVSILGNEDRNGFGSTGH